MAALVIVSDDAKALRRIQNLVNSQKDFKKHSTLYNHLFGWWSDVDCEQVINDWLFDDIDKREEIIKEIGGLKVAVEKLAEAADRYFDGNEGVNWNYLETLWSTIVKETANYA